MENKKTLFGISFVTLLFIGIPLSFLLYSPSPLAAPKVNWNPSTIYSEVAVDEAEEITVIFTPSKNAEGVYFELTPSLQPFIHISPLSLGDVTANTNEEITLTVSDPAASTFDLIEGVLHVRDLRDKNLAKPLPITTLLTVEPIPPDPGEAGKATLEGIDSDGDGVRDDVQRWIVVTYPESEKLRKGMFQYANALQQALIDSADESVSVTNAEKADIAAICLVVIAPDISPAEMRSEMINTEERMTAYLQYDDHLAGKMFDMPMYLGEFACDFDVSAAEN